MKGVFYQFLSLQELNATKESIACPINSGQVAPWAPSGKA